MEMVCYSKVFQGIKWRREGSRWEIDGISGRFTMKKLIFVLDSLLILILDHFVEQTWWTSDTGVFD